MESLIQFQPATGTVDEWNDACTRVDDYLRAHRIRNKLHQQRLLVLALTRAATCHQANPTRPPVVYAVEEIDRIIDLWFKKILQGEHIDPDVLETQGRVGMLVADLPAQWPYLFSDSEQLPEEIRKRMRETTIQAGPTLQLSSMVPRPIDLGVITETAGDTWESFEKWPMLKLFFLWGVFLVILAYLFLKLHQIF